MFVDGRVEVVDRDGDVIEVVREHGRHSTPGSPQKAAG
jgi:hypothetical protein